MIPILYKATETTFTSNGLGRLSDCISATVTEERNGRYDMEFQYPVNGIHFDDITEGRIIAVTHDESGDVQPFVIYSSSKPIDGIVTFNAYHLSYRLGMYATRYTYQGTATCQYLLTGLQNQANLNNETWSFLTDISGTYSEWGAPGGVRLPPRSIRECLGGAENSILSIFGGEYEFDTWTVNLWSARGANNGVTVSYGKNLADFKAETDFSGAATAIVAYYTGDWLANGTRQHGTITRQYDTGHTLLGGRKAEIIVDLSDKIENGESKSFATIESELLTAATAYANDNRIWEPSVSIDVDFVQLWQTEEYKNYAPLLKCKLCDSVNVSFPFYGLSDLAVKIVSVEWDVLLERYQKMTLGGLATTLEQSINSGVSGSIQANADAISNLDTRTTSVTALTLTRSTNSYVDATNFARMVAYQTGAKTGVLYLNLQLSSTMASGTALTQIGTLSGATPLVSHLISVPCQSNNSTLLVELTTAGVINIGNYSGTATGTNFFRAVIPLTFS